MKSSKNKISSVILVDELMAITEQSWPELCGMLRINDIPEPIIHGNNTLCWSRKAIDQWMDNYDNKVSPEKVKYYAVRKGAKPGVYTDWDTVKNLVHGHSYAKQKAFDTYEEAQAYVDGK